MSESATPSMAVSVIIPTRNRKSQVSALLRSLGEVRETAMSWEIVVVDNDSTDGTGADVLAVAATLGTPVRCVTEREPGLHAGRHRGAREARGEILAYLDDDVLVHPDWLSGAHPVMNGMADAVACRILPQWEAPVPGWLAERVKGGTYGPLTLLDRGDEQHEIDPGLVWGAGFFVRRSVVFDLGGFHPDSMPADLLKFRGDGESGLMRKFARAGLHAWYEPASVVLHCVPPTRMTVAYVRERYFRQGISDSYSDMRADLYFPGQDPAPEKGAPLRTPPHRGWSIRPRALARVGRRWTHPRAANAERARRRLSREFEAARSAGWEFHRSAVAADPALLRWVRQPDYLDVSIREFLDG